jgi:hypothetical protein
MPDVVNLEEIPGRLITVMRKLGAATVEFGFHVDGLDQERDPAPTEEITWWAKASHRSPGIVWSAEHRCRASDMTGAVRVLADLATKMGANVRIRWEEAVIVGKDGERVGEVDLSGAPDADRGPEQEGGAGRGPDPLPDRGP